MHDLPHLLKIGPSPDSLSFAIVLLDKATYRAASGARR
jgi:hypothetical protein